jgi:hypothetical protein
MSKDYGENLNWFLGEVENADKDQLEDGEIEIHGETEDGRDCCGTIDLRELCGAALTRIKELDLKLGLLDIAYESKSTLLASCETALALRDGRIKDLQRDATRYEYLRDEDNWGEDSGDDCWEALGEAHGVAFDEIVDSRWRRLSDDDRSPDNAL